MNTTRLARLSAICLILCACAMGYRSVTGTYTQHNPDGSTETGEFTNREVYMDANFTGHFSGDFDGKHVEGNVTVNSPAP